MVNRKKKYLGTLQSEELAAKFYDKVAIQYQGAKAKTNFPYNKQQVIQILRLQPLLTEVDFGDMNQAGLESDVEYWGLHSLRIIMGRPSRSHSYRGI